MKQIRLMTILASILLVLGSSCNDEVDVSVLKQQEERYFNLYISSNYPDVTPTESGLYYKNFKEGTGASPDTGDFVLINFVAYTIPDEIVVDTYDEEWAINNNIYYTGVLYGPYKYIHGSEIDGLREGVSMMKEGGVSRLVFKSDLGFGEEGQGSLIGKYESLMYDVELLEVITDASAREFDQIQDYLAENEGFTTIFDQETESYMYYIIDEQGEGDFIEEEDLVEVFYTGQLLDGRVFDSNEDDSEGMMVTIGDEEVIAGWEVGLKYFRYGDKGKLLIPHPLGYGEEGSIVTGTAKYAVPPFEALLFDVAIEPKEESEEEE